MIEKTQHQHWSWWPQQRQQQQRQELQELQHQRCRRWIRWSLVVWSILLSLDTFFYQKQQSQKLQVQIQFSKEESRQTSQQQQQRLQNSTTTSSAITATSTVTATRDEKPPAQYCVQHRGANGRWILDWDYAATAQYEMIGSMPQAVLANQVYRPTPAEPFRRATAYRWQDDLDNNNNNHEMTCPMSRLATLDEFCRVCQRLQIDQIWVAGDSLSEAFSHSLRTQLGFVKNAYLTELIKPLTITCPNNNSSAADADADAANSSSTQPSSYQIQHRFDRIDFNFSTGLFGGGDRTTTPALVKARRSFLQRQGTTTTNGRTAMILNLGVHLHSMTDYQTAFDDLWKSLGRVLSSSSSSSTTTTPLAPLIWFRNASPGHKGCMPDSNGPIKQSPIWNAPIEEEPFANYSDYEPTMTDLYDWNLIPEFNRYAKDHLPQWFPPSSNNNYAENNNHSNTNNVYYLNIFNMTVLRRDGHVGFGDCLHYYYPGPIDWWVHLWYSSLKDMADLQDI